MLLIHWHTCGSTIVDLTLRHLLVHLLHLLLAIVNQRLHHTWLLHLLLAVHHRLHHRLHHAWLHHGCLTVGLLLDHLTICTILWLRGNAIDSGAIYSRAGIDVVVVGDNDLCWLVAALVPDDYGTAADKDED